MFLLIYIPEPQQSDTTEILRGCDTLTKGGTSPETPVTHSELAPSPENPWVAIIIDDFGPNWKSGLVDGFLDLPFDLTVSVLPGNRKTVSVGLRAVEKGKEVFIHLPMEPIDSVALKERDMVNVGIDQGGLYEILDRTINELPAAVGMNNHMGSKATTDANLMNIFAAALKSRGLMFVDSRTDPNTCALNAMNDAGVPALGRDIFLDFYYEDERITDQLTKLMHIAQRRGWSVGIGHVRSLTLKVLTRELLRWQDEGITFVTAGKLIETIRDSKYNEKTVAHIDESD